MVPLRSVIAFFLSAALVGAGCATQTPERRVVPDLPYSVQNELGYNDVLRLTHEYATAEGYELSTVLGVEQVRRNYWRVRYGLSPRGSGKLLDIDFDTVQRRVVGTTEVGAPPAP